MIKLPLYIQHITLPKWKWNWDLLCDLWASVFVCATRLYFWLFCKLTENRELAYAHSCLSSSFGFYENQLKASIFFLIGTVSLWEVLLCAPITIKTTLQTFFFFFFFVLFTLWTELQFMINDFLHNSETISSTILFYNFKYLISLNTSFV